VARLVTRVQFLGLLDDLEGAHVVDRDLTALIFARLSEAGVGKKGGLLLSAAHQVADYRKLVEDALEDTEQSPMPEMEWLRLPRKPCSGNWSLGTGSGTSRDR
jgi:hypothetical protein